MFLMYKCYSQIKTLEEKQNLMSFLNILILLSEQTHGKLYKNQNKAVKSAQIRHVFSFCHSETYFFCLFLHPFRWRLVCGEWERVKMAQVASKSRTVPIPFYRLVPGLLSARLVSRAPTSMLSGRSLTQRSDVGPAPRRRHDAGRVTAWNVVVDLGAGQTEARLVQVAHRLVGLFGR